MNGILNVLKPPGMTSFDVVAFLRKVLGTRKIGHTGTLDPETTGVLPLCIGKATKAVEFLVEKVKTYRAELTLGITTDTCDATGRITGRCDDIPSYEKIVNVINSFRGKQKQIPPMYSAVSINGVRLYKLAREGKVIEREPREIEIYYINIVDFLNSRKVLIDVSCSKGTYIRTLCADIGEKLGCGAHMSYLTRTGSGIFSIDDAFTLEEIICLAEENKLELMPVQDALNEYSKITLYGRDIKKYVNGENIAVQFSTLPSNIVRVFEESQKFVGIGEVTKRNGQFLLKSKKLFNDGSGDE